MIHFIESFSKVSKNQFEKRIKFVIVDLPCLKPCCHSQFFRILFEHKEFSFAARFVDLNKFWNFPSARKDSLNNIWSGGLKWRQHLWILIITTWNLLSGMKAFKKVFEVQIIESIIHFLIWNGSLDQKLYVELGFSKWLTTYEAMRAKVA